MDGILPLWKPRGMTSHDCVMKIRKLYQTKKVGHTGTLDPEVEGVLPICIGQATKIVQFLTDTEKTYIAELKLGETTETEDSYGNVVKKVKVDRFPTNQEIDYVFQSFRGDITQIPPMYSAVKVNGRRLYEYARAGEVVERPERQVHIFYLERLSTDVNDNTIEFKVVCSKGTYIRTLCVDIGEKLGYPAHMSNLKRTQTGAFTESNAVTFETIMEAKEKNEMKFLLQPIVMGIEHLDRIYVDEETKWRIANGQKLPRPAKLPVTNPFAMIYGTQVLAIYQLHEKNQNEIKAVRVFNGLNEK